MHTNIRKWGNSAGTIIPANILQEAGLEIGDALDAQVVEGRVILSPVEAELTLEDLLAGSPKENLAITDEDREWLDASGVGSEI
ncbi:MAG: AbrB/MazE/SpoVT family DNA-binding domain-containing protein [Halieaceae bacterium]|nr:AbrB/MazE/SpoVT family DNA-binding domain-containing protein [Halieaceae bacterium]